MSLNYIKELDPTLVVDTRIDLTDKKNADFAVYKGPKNADFYEISPTSGPSSENGTSDFTYTLPSRQNIINRVIYLKGQVTYSLQTTAVNNTSGRLNGGQRLFQQGNWGPRSWPLNRMIQTLQLDFDGNQVSVNLEEIFDVQTNYMFIEEELKTFSTTSPTLLDNSFLFAGTAANSSPLGYFSNIGTGFVPTRSSFQLKRFTNPAIADGTSGTAILEYNFCEPINISPLITKALKEYTSEGLSGISTLKIKITWKSPQEMFDKSFCYNILDEYKPTLTNAVIDTPAPENLGTLGAGVNFNQSNYTRSAKVDELKAIISILTLPDGSAIPPPINNYDYVRHEHHRKGPKTIDPLGDVIVDSDNFNLSGIPHSMIVWGVVAKNGAVARNIVGRTNIPEFSLPNAYIPITKIEVKIGNQPYVLSDVKPSTLFLMNVNNGCRFKNFSSSGMDGSGGLTVLDQNQGAVNVLLPIGAPLMLKFGKDIPIMDSTLAPGVAVNLQLNFRVTFKNYTSQPLEIEMRCLFLYEGSFTVSTMGSSYVTTPLLRSDVITAPERGGEIDASELSPENLDGKALIAGSFIGKLKKFGNKTWKFLNKPQVKNILRESLDLASAMNIPGASQIEYALDKGQDVSRALKGKGGMLLDRSQGGNYMNSVGSGNFMNSVGSGYMTPAQLRARMKK